MDNELLYRLMLNCSIFHFEEKLKMRKSYMFCILMISSKPLCLCYEIPLQLVRLSLQNKRHAFGSMDRKVMNWRKTVVSMFGLDSVLEQFS